METEKVSMKQRKAHENEKTAGEKGKFSFHQLFSFGAPERTVLLRNPRKAFFISSRAASCTVLSRIFGFRLESGTGKEDAHRNRHLLCGLNKWFFSFAPSLYFLGFM
jgi:hypothetical protein